MTQLSLRGWIPRFCPYSHENCRPTYWTDFNLLNRRNSIYRTTSTATTTHLPTKNSRRYPCRIAENRRSCPAKTNSFPRLAPSSNDRQRGAPTARKGCTNGGGASPWMRRGACYSTRATVVAAHCSYSDLGFPPSFYWWPAPHEPPGPRPEAQVAEELQKPPFLYV